MYGALGFENSTATSLFSGIIGVNTQTTVNNTFTIVLFALTLLIFFTLGFTKVGTTYIYRNMMSGEAIFPFSDFFYVIKRNKKQSLLLGFIDAFFIVMLERSISLPPSREIPVATSEASTIPPMI